MNVQYKSFLKVPSPLRIASRNDYHSASECWGIKKPLSSTSFRHLLLRPFPVRLPAFSCSLFILLRVLIISGTTRLKLPLSIIISLYVLWQPSQGCCLSELCRNADAPFAAGVPKQEGVVSGKHFQVFSLSSEILRPLSATRSASFEKNCTASPSIVKRCFRVALHDGCGLNSSIGTTFDDVSQYKQTLSFT